MPDDAYTEMKLLRMAYRLLVATNQLDDVADAVIAEQTMHVLLYGTRQSEQEDEAPPQATAAAHQDDRVPFDLDEETLRAHNLDYAITVHIPGDGLTDQILAQITEIQEQATALLKQAKERPGPTPTVSPPHIPGYEAVNIPDSAPIYFPLAEPDGFTIPARVAQLGYHCTPSEAVVHGPQLITLARETWRRKFLGEPAHTDEGYWYGREHAPWIDPLIHAYMATRLAVAQAGEEA